MTLVKIHPRTRYVKANVLARFEIKGGAQRIAMRFMPELLNLLDIKAGEKVAIFHERENSKILFLKKEEPGYKISSTGRMSIKCPFTFEKEMKHIGVPYEIKDGGIYLYFDKIEDRTPILPGIEVSTTIQPYSLTDLIGA